MARAPRSSTAMALTLFVMAALVGLGMGIACSPEEKHRVLTFFFDDVPPLESADTLAAATQAAGTQAAGTQAAATRRRRPPIKGSVHKPFKENQCVRCHEGRFSMKVVVDPVTLCKRCHKDFLKPLKYVHGPVAVFYCSLCHHPHSSPLPHLLKKRDPVICFECHEQDSVLAARYHGPEAEQGCARCHNPHGGDNRMFLMATQTRPSTMPSPATRPSGNGKG